MQRNLNILREKTSSMAIIFNEDTRLLDLKYDMILDDSIQLFIAYNHFVGIFPGLPHLIGALPFYPVILCFK